MCWLCFCSTLAKLRVLLFDLKENRKNGKEEKPGTEGTSRIIRFGRRNAGLHPEGTAELHVGRCGTDLRMRREHIHLDKGIIPGPEEYCHRRQRVEQ